MKFSKLSSTEQAFVTAYRAEQEAARKDGNTARWVSYKLADIMYLGRGTVSSITGRILFMDSWMAARSNDAA